ncbi:hypothetical protein Gorai_004174 [Gossypium raimondii]|uniref:Uncharacterized protein n=1 Tax=Gossypium raimondii TaxID=29730 RepID=A0A7J8QI90_GOSRA|nr:hypothetical protein [Gossypium raimondii]
MKDGLESGNRDPSFNQRCSLDTAEELINSTFDAVDAERILCIPLARDPHDYGIEMEALAQNILPWRLELERWRLPKSSVVKIKFDVAFQNHFKKSCIGLVTMQLGLCMGHREVEIEGDTLTSIKKFFRYTLRKANEVAHTLVTKGIRRWKETYLSNGVPMFAVTAVEEDRWWTDPPD